MTRRTNLHQKRGHNCFKNGINDCEERKRELDYVAGEGSTFKYVLDNDKIPSWKYIYKCSDNFEKKQIELLEAIPLVESTLEEKQIELLEAIPLIEK